MNSSKKSSSIRIIEVEKGDNKPLGTAKELNAAILSLGGQLGFQELLRRNRVIVQMLRSRFENEDIEHNTLKAVKLQALIQCFKWLEQEYKKETGRPIVQHVPAEFEDERVEYDRLARAIEIVGAN